MTFKSDYPKRWLGRGRTRGRRDEEQVRTASLEIIESLEAANGWGGFWKDRQGELGDLFSLSRVVTQELESTLFR